MFLIVSPDLVEARRVNELLLPVLGIITYNTNTKELSLTEDYSSFLPVLPIEGRKTLRLIITDISGTPVSRKLFGSEPIIFTVKIWKH